MAQAVDHGLDPELSAWIRHGALHCLYVTADDEPDRPNEIPEPRASLTGRSHTGIKNCDSYLRSASGTSSPSRTCPINCLVQCLCRSYCRFHNSQLPNLDAPCLAVNLCDSSPLQRT